jgi:hypothetical protein
LIFGCVDSSHSITCYNGVGDSEREIERGAGEGRKEREREKREKREKRQKRQKRQKKKGGERKRG